MNIVKAKRFTRIKKNPSGGVRENSVVCARPLDSSEPEKASYSRLKVSDITLPLHVYCYGPEGDTSFGASVALSLNKTLKAKKLVRVCSVDSKGYETVLDCTENLQVRRVSGTYVPVTELQKGVKLLGVKYTGDSVCEELFTVKSVAYIECSDSIYNIQVADTNNFIANGLCVRI